MYSIWIISAAHSSECCAGAERAGWLWISGYTGWWIVRYPLFYATPIVEASIQGSAARGGL